MLKKQYPETLWQAYIPIDTRLRDASRVGLVPSRFDKTSRAILAYRSLLKHVLAKFIEQTPRTEPMPADNTAQGQ